MNLYNKTAKMICLFFLAAAMLIITGCGNAVATEERANERTVQGNVTDETTAVNLPATVANASDNGSASDNTSDVFGESDNTNDTCGETFAECPPFIPREPDTLVVCKCYGICTPPDANRDEWDVLYRMGDIIVASGEFWEEVWNLTGRFRWENLVWENGEPDERLPEHLHFIYLEVLPSSGFKSLADVRLFLSQFYTEARIDVLLGDDFPFFAEHGGALFLHVARHCSTRPIWITAIHRLIGQENGCAVVETEVFYFAPDSRSFYCTTLRFTFTNGRINSASHCRMFGYQLY